MKFHYIKPSKSDAYDNMAQDLLMLKTFPTPNSIRFRHYGWTENNAYTFGYFQKWSDIKKHSDNTSTVLCRRPTGGGIVDHTNDWTYSLIIPPTHSLYKEKACKTYKQIHQAIAETLKRQGIDTDLEGSSNNCSGTGTCFEKPSPADVIIKGTDIKIAGAAQKRTREGLLTQGSILKDNLKGVNWPQFHNQLTERLSNLLGATPEEFVEDFNYPSEELKKWTTLISGDTWQKRR